MNSKWWILSERFFFFSKRCVELLRPRIFNKNQHPSIRALACFRLHSSILVPVQGFLHELMLKAQPEQKPGLTFLMPLATAPCSVLFYLALLLGIWLATLNSQPAATANTVSFHKTCEPILSIPKPPAFLWKQRWVESLSRSHTQTLTCTCLLTGRILSGCVEILAKEQWVPLWIKALPKCKMLSGNNLTMLKVSHNCCLVVIIGQVTMYSRERPDEAWEAGKVFGRTDVQWKILKAWFLQPDNEHS